MRYLLILLLSLSVYGQREDDLPKHSHTDNSVLRFSYIRMPPPVTIVSYNAATGQVDYRAEDKDTILKGEVFVSDDTITDSSFNSGVFKGKFFWILRCLGGHAYVIQEVNPKNIKKEAKK